MKISNPPEGWPGFLFGKNTTLSAVEETMVDFHSLLNLLNIISLSVEYWETDTPPSKLSRKITETEIPEIKQSITGDSHLNLKQIRNKCRDLCRSFRKLQKQLKKTIEDQEPLFNAHDILFLLETQMDELQSIMKHPTRWKKTQIADVESRLNHFFRAMERNARGRYFINFNPSKSSNNTPHKTYTVDLEIENAGQKYIHLPTSFVTTIQDLSANARKYSNVGSTIESHLKTQNGFLQFTIRDNGCGIPENEIEKVVEYGYRGSNSLSVATLGGGFGLTRALKLCKTFNGTLQIASELNTGTWIQIRIPLPDGLK